MNYVNRIQTTPMRPMPNDTIRTHGPIKLMIGAAPDHKISVGLLIDAPAPIGAIEIALTGAQVYDLEHQLHSLVNLQPDELAALIERLHQDDQ
ncbi:hypothetical protein ACLILY_07140 [Mycobacterium sp. MS3]|uniref:hypothetical protein n=1 Tax=Mycobacterium sp. MS3 TaxID=3391378 RepID=UPI003989EA52